MAIINVSVQSITVGSPRNYEIILLTLCDYVGEFLSLQPMFHQEV